MNLNVFGYVWAVGMVLSLPVAIGLGWLAGAWGVKPTEFRSVLYSVACSLVLNAAVMLIALTAAGGWG